MVSRSMFSLRRREKLRRRETPDGVLSPGGGKAKRKSKVLRVQHRWIRVFASNVVKEVVRNPALLSHWDVPFAQLPNAPPPI